MQNPYATPDAKLQHSIDQPLLERLSSQKLKVLYRRSRTVKVIAGLWLFFGMLFALCAILAMFGVLTPADLSRSEFVIGSAVLALATLIPGIGLIGRAAWGKVAGIGACILSLFGFPVGTLIGVLGLAAIFGAPELFGKHRISHTDIKAAYKTAKLHAD